MRQKSGPQETAEKHVKDIRRRTRRKYSAEEKIRIVLEGLRGEYSIAELCRREGFAHRTTKVNRPQSNGFVERLHRALLDEQFRVQGRKKWYETVEEMQTDLDAYHLHYNSKRPHQSRAMKGRTPYKAFTDGLPKKENAKMRPKTKAA